MLVVAASLALLVCAYASILAVGDLSECINDGALTCQKKILVTMTIQNQQSNTETLSTFQVSHLVDSHGLSYDVHDRLEISLAKSIVGLKYPLVYFQDFNNKPYEVIRTKDGGGTNYDRIFNPCSDGLNSNSACGVYIDANTGQPMPYSSGFCCACSLSDYFGLSTATMSRAGLSCNIFSGGASEAGHCLRYDPLWYSSFTVQPPAVSYDILATVTHCNDTYCGPDTVSVLSPEVPGLCINRSDYGPPVEGCNVRISLEGDFAAFQDPPSFESRMLMVPYWCDDPAICLDRLTESSDYWLLIDNSLITRTGLECDKIGVSHEAFYGQGSKCTRLKGSCLNGQIQNYYESEKLAESRGRTGTMFVKYNRMGGGFTADTSVLSTSKPSMTFFTDRFQKTVVTLVIAADTVKYTLTISRALIVNITAPDFEAFSLGGQVNVVLQNVGPNAGDFTVDISCSEGFLPVLSKQVTIGPQPAFMQLSFVLFTDSNVPREAVCVATVLDGIFVQNDIRAVHFNVSAYKNDRGAQGGSLSAGAPLTSDSNSSATAGGTCSHQCPNRWNVFCTLAHPLACIQRLSFGLMYLAPLLAYAALAAKFPSIFLGPCKLLLGLCAASQAASMLSRRNPPAQQPAASRVVPKRSEQVDPEAEMLPPEAVSEEKAEVGRIRKQFSRAAVIANDMGVVVAPRAGPRMQAGL